MCRGQFLKNGWKKQNTIYSDLSTAQAEFKSTNRSKIGSFYEELFQHKGTVPNDQIWPSPTDVSQNTMKHHVFGTTCNKCLWGDSPLTQEFNTLKFAA